MASADLLSKICDELDARLRELRPLVAEYESLLVAVSALDAAGEEESASATDGAGRTPVSTVSAPAPAVVTPARRRGRPPGKRKLCAVRTRARGWSKHACPIETHSATPGRRPQTRSARRGGRGDPRGARARLAHCFGAGRGHSDARSDHQQQPAPLATGRDGHPYQARGRRQGCLRADRLKPFAEHPATQAVDAPQFLDVLVIAAERIRMGPRRAARARGDAGRARRRPGRRAVLRRPAGS